MEDPGSLAQRSSASGSNAGSNRPCGSRRTGAWPSDRAAPGRRCPSRPPSSPIPSSRPRIRRALQLNAWYTSGMVVARRPPKIIALIGTPLGSSRCGSMSRTLRCGSCKSRVRMRGLPARLLPNLGSPLVALPVQALGRRLIRHAFPPHTAFRRQRDVGEDGILRQRGHGVGIVLLRCPEPREEAGFRIDRVQASSASGLIDAMIIVIVHTLQPSNPCARGNHIRNCFASVPGKCGNEHVLCIFNPSVSAMLGSDSGCAKHFAEQGIAAIAGSERPDSRVSGKWTMYFSLLHGHAHLSGRAKAARPRCACTALLASPPCRSRGRPGARCAP